jgi:hypothetical protein
MGGEEFINNRNRWCLWLADVSPGDLKSYPLILNRIKAVKNYRLSSNRQTTVKLADFPTLFGENRQPHCSYLLLPKVSSENRQYMPMGFCQPDVIASGSCLVVKDAKLYHFGVLTSAMHMAWMRSVCGRLESRYQYSNSIVYNNFPWPLHPTDKQQQAIEAAAQAVLAARAGYPESSLAALYDPLTMPPDLVKAHRRLDAAVDAAYARRRFTGDGDRLAFLFELYQRLTGPLVAPKPRRRQPAR